MKQMRQLRKYIEERKPKKITLLSSFQSHSASFCTMKIDFTEMEVDCCVPYRIILRNENAFIQLHNVTNVKIQLDPAGIGDLICITCVRPVICPNICPELEMFTFVAKFV